MARIQKKEGFIRTPPDCYGPSSSLSNLARLRLHSMLDFLDFPGPGGPGNSFLHLFWTLGPKGPSDKGQISSQLVTASLSFKKHTCTGRYFPSTALKAIMQT